MTTPSAATRGLASAMTPSTDQSSVRRRWGIVKAINSNGTVNVDIAGVTIPNVKRLASYRPSVNERVQIDVVGTDMVVSGATAPSARADREPVGEIEPTLRRTPKPDTLLLDGAQVSRTTYAELWAWVQAQNLVTPGLFTNGNGTTTFGLPDFRNRFIMGLPAGGTPGTIVGANTVTLAAANLPAHKHDVAVANHTTHTHGVAVAAHAQHDHNVSASTGSDSHSHSGDTNGIGNHGGHWNGGRNNPGYAVDGGAQAYINPDSNLTAGGGGHSHTVSTNSDTHNHSVSVSESMAGPTTHSVTESAAGPTTHTVTETTVGQGTAVENRPESISLNWLIWV